VNSLFLPSRVRCKLNKLIQCASRFLGIAYRAHSRRRRSGRSSRYLLHSGRCRIRCNVYRERAPPYVTRVWSPGNVTNQQTPGAREKRRPDPLFEITRIAPALQSRWLLRRTASCERFAHTFPRMQGVRLPSSSDRCDDLAACRPDALPRESRLNVSRVFQFNPVARKPFTRAAGCGPGSAPRVTLVTSPDVSSNR
jgi:hypothetical protein